MRSKKSVLICTFLALGISAMPVAYKVSAASAAQGSYTRLYGQDRYQTAVSVSREGWSDGSDYAVIVSGEEYTDSFCAVPLAKANNAPILLTKKDSLNQNTLNELKRLQVKHIYLIGSENNISKNVENQLKLQVTSDVQRISGNDNYDTSVKITEKLGTPSKVILVSDKGYADALSSSSIAAIEGMPILVTNRDYLPKSVSDYIKSHNITKTYIIGGTASISNSVASLVPGAERLQGQDRYETNVNVMNAFLDDLDFSNVYAVSANPSAADAFADSLGGAALAAKTNSPIVLVGSELESSAQDFIKTNLSPGSKVTVLAGPSNIPDSAAEEFNIASQYLSINNQAYKDNIQGNANITGDNISFKGNVSGNLYISGNNVSISNAVVQGTVFIDPGSSGTTNLDTVTAKNIVILSGTKDGIDLKNVKADTLVVKSKNNVKVIADVETKINNTTVASQCTLQNISTGNFGSVTLNGLSIDKPVTFDGGFGAPVTVENSAMLRTLNNTTISQLNINSTDADAQVILSGNFGTVEVNGNTNLMIDASAKVTGSINVNSTASIRGSKTAAINEIDIQPTNNDTINLYGNFGETPINVNASAKINLAYGALIETISVDKNAALAVYINVPNGATLYKVKGDAIITGDGADSVGQDN